MSLNEDTNGVFTIVTTPFKPDETLDLDSIGQLVDFYRAKGCNGMTLLGVMGEAPKLSSSETRALVSEVVRCADGMPVLAGIAAPGLAQIQEMAHGVMRLGVSGVMINAAHTIRTDADCLNYFKGVASRLGDDVPFVLQDFPLATGVRIPIHVIEQVIREHSNCVMLKQEDWPGWHKIDHLRQASSRGELRRISILTGFGGLYLPEDLMQGLVCSADVPNTSLAAHLRDNGLLVVKAAGNVIRLLPPLIATEDHVDEAVGILDATASEVAKAL